MSARFAKSEGFLGTPSECRRREAVYQQLSCDIMREARDLLSLATAASRAMGHADVRRDGLLAGMVRGCIAAREAELRSKLAEQRRSDELTEGHAVRPAHDLHGPAGWQNVAAAAPAAPDKAQIVASFERLRREYDDRLVHFELERARDWLHKIEDLHAKHPDVISSASLERCRIDCARVEQKKKQLAAEIDLLARSAVEAAGDGRHEEAAQALKRLSSMQATRPQLFPDDRLQKIRDEVSASGETFEHREASRALVARERAIAGELKKLAEIVHRFHEVARQVPPDDPLYALGEDEYRRAIREIRHHDKDWLADLMIELNEKLEAMHDPTGRAEDHVNRFLASVRATLNQTILEIKQIVAESAAAAQPRTASAS